MSNANFLSEAELIRAQAWLELINSIPKKNNLSQLVICTGLQRSEWEFPLEGPGPQARTDHCPSHAIVLLNALTCAADEPRRIK